MIVYNSFLAKWFRGKKRKHYFMFMGIFFTRYRYLEIWEEMELHIHERQYAECLLLTIIPALALSLWFSCWAWMILPFMTYELLYWPERIWRRHSVFDWEAMENCGDSLYLRKRKKYAWMKHYCRKSLPISEWDD